MEKIKIEVPDSHSGKRIDKYLVDALKNRFSRSFIKKLIDQDNIIVSGSEVNAHYKVSPGDTIEIDVPDPKSLKLKPENIPLKIIYEDDDIVVVDKSYGMSVHPAGPHITGTLVNALLYRCKNLSGIGGILRPGIVHRLDKDTSGVLVVAKNDAAHKNLSGQFKNRRVKRRYIALVRGMVQLDNGKIDLPIARRKTDITKMGISFVEENKKNAVTNYTVLKRFKDFTMLEVRLETGRTHQIRVHLSHIGHPVAGDRKYGSAKGMERQALHAKKLGFYHPTTKKFMEFESAIPRDMQELIDRGKL